MFLNKVSSTATWILFGALALIGASAGSAQTISVYSGDGQLVLSNHISNQPLIVQVKDAAGNPVVGATVTWAVQGQGNLSTTTTTTDANGLASSSQFFIAPSLFTAQSTAYIQSTVSASLATGATANFTETTYFQDPVTSANFVQAFLVNPTLGAPLPTGQGGVPGTTPIQVHVQAINGTQAGGGVPHVAVQVIAENATGPTIVCQGGVVYTNASGDAVCTPIFGGVGTGTFTVAVGGGQTNFTSLPYTVLLGAPNIITVSGGNNQSATPGATLPVTLSATITDAAGNAVPNIPVVFEAETPGTVSFTNLRNTSDASGRVSANAILGSTPGTYKVRVRTTTGTSISAEFTFTVNVTVSGLSKVSGEPQSALVSTGFTFPIIVQVNDATLKGIPGATVTFAVASGSAVIATPTATTDANGRASTTVTAGPVAGPVVITATSGGFVQSFSLTVAPPGPTCTAASITNAVTQQAGGLAPGALATFTCAGVAPLIQGTVTPPTILGNLVPMVILAGASVQFNGIFAPIVSLSNNAGTQSITVQVPFEVAPGPANVTVTANGVTETAFGVTIQAFSPGLIEWVMADNVRRAFVVRPNGTVVSTSNPALRNEILRAYAVGLGPVNPAISTTQFDPIDTDPAVTSPVVIGVNNAGVQVVNATYARNLIGVYEVRFIITDPGPSSPNIPFAIAVTSNGALVFGQASLLPLQ